MYSTICSKASLSGVLRPQSARPVPIGLASSKPGMSWQPEQPYLVIVRRPTYCNCLSVGHRADQLDLVALELAAALLGNAGLQDTARPGAA